MQDRRMFGKQIVLEQNRYTALDFSNVSMRTFPLRANLVQLQRFCDSYLNLDIPPDIAYFRPIAPFVIFQVINYGRMSPTTHSLGYVAQHEVLFGVPVIGRWYEQGKVVNGMATVSPFIFVDNDWSVIAGREIYGWPKYPANLAPQVSPWIQDPRLQRRLLTLKTMLFPDLYSAQSLQMLPLLGLIQDPGHLAENPPDVEYLLNPMMRIPKAFVDTMSSMPDVFQNLAQMWSQDQGATLAGTLQDLSQNILSLPPETLFNSVNLKQFRSSDARKACYQSLVVGKMQLTKSYGGGLLGSVEQLRGDPTGGFTLLLHRYPDFPIIEALGLEVEEEFTTSEGTVAALKPLLPSWSAMDLRYSRGERLCWRTQDTQWAKNDEPAPPGRPSSQAYYSTSLGPVVSPVEGPFDFLDTTVRILPLPGGSKPGREEIRQIRKDAHLPTSGRPIALEVMEARLEEAVREAMKLFDEDDEFADIEITAKFLDWSFLVVKSFGPLTATNNNLGWWGGRAVDFVRIMELSIRLPDQTQEEAFVNNFLVIPFAFANTPQAVSAGREILGLPTAFSRIKPGTDPWIDSGVATGTPRCLLEVDVRDYPALGVGQAAQERPLVEIHRVQAPVGEPAAPAHDEMAEQLERFRARYQSRYAKGVRVSTLSFKQFPDEEDPVLVCYRALVAQERILGKWAGDKGGPAVQMEKLPGEYEISLHELPSWSIVDFLNLDVARWEVSDKGNPVAIVKVEYPHWIKVDLHWNLPIDLAWQSVDGDWRLGKNAADYMAWLLSEAQFGKWLDVDSEASDGYQKWIEKYLAALRAPIEPMITSPQAGEVKSLNELLAEFARFTENPIKETIELEAASLEDVWKALTDREWIGHWFGQPTDLTPALHSEGWMGRGSERLAVKIERLEPVSELSWVWALEPDTPLDKAKSIAEIEWNLSPREGGGTILDFRMSGVDPKLREFFEKEWGEALSELRLFLSNLSNRQPVLMKMKPAAKPEPPPGDRGAA